MSQPVTPPVEATSHQPRPRDKFDRERATFWRLLPDLLKTHRGLHVAIHEEQVVDSGEDEIDLIRRTLEKVGNVDIYVGLVSDEPPPVVRMRTPREIRRA